MDTVRSHARNRRGALQILRICALQPNAPGNAGSLAAKIAH
jgi:hypothetical protein